MTKGNGAGKKNGKRNGDTPAKTDTRALTPKEAKLVELLADPEDTRSKEDKAVDAGFYPKHVYEKERQPHFAEALDKRIGENMRRIKSGRLQVLQAIKNRALGEAVLTDDDGNPYGVDAKDANKAAELFLKVTGDITSGYNFQVTQVNENAQVRESRKGRLGAYLTRSRVSELTD